MKYERKENQENCSLLYLDYGNTAQKKFQVVWHIFLITLVLISEVSKAPLSYWFIILTYIWCNCTYIEIRPFMEYVSNREDWINLIINLYPIPYFLKIHPYLLCSSKVIYTQAFKKRTICSQSFASVDKLSYAYFLPFYGGPPLFGPWNPQHSFRNFVLSQKFIKKPSCS